MRLEKILNYFKYEKSHIINCKKISTKIEKLVDGLVYLAL